MAETVQYIIDITGNAVSSIEKIGEGVDKASDKVNKFVGLSQKIAYVGIAFQSVMGAINKVNSVMSGMVNAYKEGVVAENKLAQVMRNTMGAGRDELQSILELTAAQQKLGVIEDDVQLAGAQEMATYLGEKSSLEKLIPAMNDMLAQQYGLNASQEQSVQIATMLGKVMQGQTGALSRYGYGFTEAQEKILKTGTEAERAAVLFDVVSESVGGMNEALAATPEGRLKQQANTMGDLGERIGGLFVRIQSAFSPLISKIGDGLDTLISYFEANRDKIIGVVTLIQKVITKAFSGIMVVIKAVWSVFTGFVNGVKNGNPIFIGLAAIIAGVTTTLILYKTWTTAVAVAQAAATLATSVWTGAQWLLNAALTLNPIGIIIAAIVALIAVIAYVAYTTDGWGKTWSNVMTWMKLGIQLFKENISLQWMQIKDVFLTGFEVIEKGWYKLKSLWDKEGAQAGLAELERQRNERANEIAAAQNKVNEIRDQMREMTVWEVKSNGKGMSDVVDGLKKKLGIGGANEQLQTAVGAGSGAGQGNMGGAGLATEAVATGGTRNTTVNISFGKGLIENIIFNGGTKENQSEIERNLAEAMYRVLGIAESAVS
ncbi:MAG: hypothetical protein LBN37_03295 [Bacteroidales bacterium]|jgi:hypothetical protein|nr:hypothetical protein [Bacteroidales bacterium]